MRATIWLSNCRARAGVRCSCSISSRVSIRIWRTGRAPSMKPFRPMPTNSSSRHRRKSIAKLRGFRRLFGATTSPPEPDLALFERVLARARDDVHGWGGRMAFAYLPSWNTVFRPTASLDRMREGVLDIARRLDLTDGRSPPRFRPGRRPAGPVLLSGLALQP
jgi:hypothetical protein